MGYTGKGCEGKVLSDGISGRTCIIRAAEGAEEGKRAGKTSQQDVQKALGLGATGVTGTNLDQWSPTGGLWTNGGL